MNEKVAEKRRLEQEEAQLPSFPPPPPPIYPSVSPPGAVCRPEPVLTNDYMPRLQNSAPARLPPIQRHQQLQQQQGGGPPPYSEHFVAPPPGNDVGIRYFVHGHLQTATTPGGRFHAIHSIASPEAASRGCRTTRGHSDGGEDRVFYYVSNPGGCGRKKYARGKERCRRSVLKYVFVGLFCTFAFLLLVHLIKMHMTFDHDPAHPHREQNSTDFGSEEQPYFEEPDHSGAEQHRHPPKGWNATGGPGNAGDV